MARYPNYAESIGYSLRFYTAGINKQKRIKLLAVNGIEPTIGNIKDGSYPLTVSLYTVTAADATPKLIDWLLSEQG